ncbi:hypothetical protein FISHEDRAFT_70336 [Fistulina hepatica ATCC 64428]|uniref:Uncharacterized protein n=1 Tax=Fistulina hepatica ATCC 64428 TaxID=1128425 RepID=A0A0D7AJU1_9AGAR|nr:hypothetical protein FISHEDRAFT_70336 [Fistulina hepatica ATCC 64428]
MAYSETSSDPDTQYSYDEKETSSLLVLNPIGHCHVKYHPDSEWDLMYDGANTNDPVDMTLCLPHHRHRGLYGEQRVAMFVGSNSENIRLKISKFQLAVVASVADVTLWLPSDFKGHICHVGSARLSLSAGFMNRILPNTRFDSDSERVPSEGDYVVVSTQGCVTLRMWDVQTSTPESVQKETFRRMFSCMRVKERRANWDCLLNRK